MAGAITLSLAMFAGTGAGRALAQAAPPDLRMLMNLDLFESRPSNMQGMAAPGADAPSDSMLDQIRALNAMGYLGNRRDADGAGAPQPASGESEPSSNPSYDVEGPQQ
jgi:hypothetical protein